PSGCGPRSIHLAADRLRLHSPPRPLLSKSPVRKDPGLRRTTGALFLWFLFRHPLGIPALGLGLRILRALLRLVAAFLHVGLRVVDHLISPPTVEIPKPASSSTITSGRRATQTLRFASRAQTMSRREKIEAGGADQPTTSEG